METKTEILQEFVQEALEEFSSLEEKFIQLEENPNDLNIINSIFRPIHSIKGNSGFWGLNNVATFSHQMESLLDDLRRDEKKVTKEIIDVLLTGTDILKGMLERISENPQDVNISESDEEFIKKIKKLTDGKSSDSEGSVSKICKYLLSISELSIKIREELEQLAGNENAMKLFDLIDRAKSEVEKFYEAKGKKDNRTKREEFLYFYDGEDYTEVMLAIFSSYERLKKNKKDSEAGNLLKTNIQRLIGIFSESDKEKVKCFNDFYETIATVVNHPLVGFEEEIVRIINVELDKITDFFNKSIRKERRKRTRRLGESRRSEDKPLSAEETKKTIRIDQKRIDKFFNCVSELVTTQEVFKYIQTKLEKNNNDSKSAKELKEAVNSLEQISDNLQKSVLEVRMIPIKHLLQRFPRIVRNLANELGKEVKFVTAGEATCIDKSLLDLLEDPLVHIIRNSVDHGIESPEERRKLNKPEYGTIIVKTSLNNDMVRIEISDDGRGIDTDKVKMKAIEKNLITKEQARIMSDKDINKFIFNPGFSTAEKISGVSGRGVGMDVVLTNINKCNGSIDINSEKGKGTTISITMPLSLVSIVRNSLIVQVMSEQFAILSDDIVEITIIPENDINKIIKGKFITLHNKIVRVVELSELLGINNVYREDSGAKSIVIVKNDNRRLGLIVDKFINQQKIVIKKFNNKVEGINGVSILKNGKVILVIDTAKIIDLSVSGVPFSRNMTDNITN